MDAISTWTIGSATITRVEEQLGITNQPCEKYFRKFERDVLERHLDWLAPDHYSPRHLAMLRAVCSGMPVARVGRGNNEGFTQAVDLFIGGGNLTSTKARLLLMACLMKFGSLPPAANPEQPTKAELDAIRARLVAFQAVFDTH